MKMNKTNTDRLSSLTSIEQDILQIMLDNPMLSNKEIAKLCGVTPATINAQVHAIYKKLIPIEIYDAIHQTKRRMYILLKYGELYPDMPDSWRETFIDPMFSTKD